MNDTKLSRTIASTATLKIANIPSLDLLYTPIEERFERITRLARRALRVPVAAITLLNGDKQWFKSVVGWGVSEIPREHSLCLRTVDENGLVVIPDTSADPRVAASPLVTAAPNFRFYAGAPIPDDEGAVTGTFCVFDIRSRQFTGADGQTVLDLAALARRELLSDRLSDAHSALISKLSIARREAMMDPLTRLWNRRGASVMLKSAFDAADQNLWPLSLALLDLDNFKRVNDTYGHHIGDDVLRRVAARLIVAVRSDDVTCRLGGDEFLIIMANTDAAVAARVAERVRCAVTDSPLPTRDGNVPMSLSVGFTVRQPREALTFDAVVERADRALLQSKSAGRNRVRMTD